MDITSDEFEGWFETWLEYSLDKKGLTKVEVSGRLGISRMALYRYIKDPKRMDMGLFLRLMILLGYRVDVEIQSN